MAKKPISDALYRNPRDHIVDFAFDEQVADVFPDMIRRSVPGYEAIISMLGVFAQHYVLPDTRVYDLGCSLGAAALAMRRCIQQSGVSMIAVDNAEAMLTRCRQNLERDNSSVPVEYICADIQNIEISNASLVVLNFTLQFINPGARLALLSNIYNGLQPGGALIVSEKITFSDEQQRQHNERLHLEFKRANGYSELEISQKRTALEKVLLPETIENHMQRFTQAGFAQADMWFRCFNFASFMALK